VLGRGDLLREGVQVGVVNLVTQQGSGKNRDDEKVGNGAGGVPEAAHRQQDGGLDETRADEHLPARPAVNEAAGHDAPHQREEGDEGVGKIEVGGVMVAGKIPGNGQHRNALGDPGDDIGRKKQPKHTFIQRLGVEVIDRFSLKGGWWLVCTGLNMSNKAMKRCTVPQLYF
jgi:hypothetical protein